MIEREEAEQQQMFDAGKLKCGWVLSEEDILYCTANGAKGKLDENTPLCDYNSCPIVVEVVYCGSNRIKKK